MIVQPHPPAAHDLFDAENRALSSAQAVFDDAGADVAGHRQALGELIAAYERLLRETRRLIRRSDREELEMNRLNQRLQELAAELEYRATHDSLTGVLNRAAVIERSKRYLGQGGLGLIVLDIDHFKRINDSFGHPVGDQVICGVVRQLQAVVPPAASIGRVGGEEFTVLLPAEGLEATQQLAERLRRAVAQHRFALEDASQITASFGVSWLARGGGFDEAYGRADEALYRAKRQGRNRVICAGREEPVQRGDAPAEHGRVGSCCR